MTFKPFLNFLKVPMLLNCDLQELEEFDDWFVFKVCINKYHIKRKLTFTSKGFVTQVFFFRIYIAHEIDFNHHLSYFAKNDFYSNLFVCDNWKNTYTVLISWRLTKQFYYFLYPLSFTLSCKLALSYPTLQYWSDPT